MELHTDTIPIIFSTSHDPYKSSNPIISWTPMFAVSAPFRQFPCLPTKKLLSSDESWTKQEFESSVIDLDQFSFPFFALEPHTRVNSEEHDLKFEWYGDSDNLDLVNSKMIILDSVGGTWDASSSTDYTDKTDGHSTFQYAIHCCVRPRFRCCVNELPVEVLEHIFWFLGYVDGRLTIAISLVCKLWNKLIVSFEADPFNAEVKLKRWKQSPGKRFNWNTCHYIEDRDDVNFHEYVHAVVQFQPLIQTIIISRSSQDCALDDLLILAKVPTLLYFTFDGWNASEIFSFLRARQPLSLYLLEIYYLTEGNEELKDVNSSNAQIQSQLFRVERLFIHGFDHSIHKILTCLQKDYLRFLELWFDGRTLDQLTDSIQLFGFENLTEIILDGGNEESNLVSFDFISKACKPSNLPKLHSLTLSYCFIDPTEVPCLLHMPELRIIKVTFFMGQKTDENEQIVSQTKEEFMSSRNDSRFTIIYSEGNDEQKQEIL